MASMVQYTNEGNQLDAFWRQICLCEGAYDGERQEYSLSACRGEVAYLW